MSFLRLGGLAEVEEEAVEAVKSVILAHVEDARPKKRVSPFDLRFESPAGALAVQVKTVSAPRVEDIVGRLAVGFLELSEKPNRNENTCAVFVYVPRLGRRALGRVEEFAKRHSKGVGWGLVDSRGTVRLELPGLANSVDRVGRPAKHSGRAEVGTKHAFSDLNRWLLKVLLLADCSSSEWGGPRKPAENPLQLSEIADTSASKAYQFTRTFVDLGFLEWEAGQYRVIRRRELFERWYTDETQVRTKAVFARPIVTDLKEVRNFVNRQRVRLDFAVGSFEACREHGVLVTTPRIPEIYVFDPIQAFLDKWELEVVSREQAQLVLRMSAFPESVHRGAVVRQGLPVVDVLQAGLDVGRDPARGREQAEYIVKHVLGWS